MIVEVLTWKILSGWRAAVSAEEVGEQGAGDS